jgi:hypothetical protein
MALGVNGGENVYHVRQPTAIVLVHSTSDCEIPLDQEKMTEKIY